MKLSLGVLNIVLFGTLAVTAPLTTKRQGRHETRRLQVAHSEGRISHPPYVPGTDQILHLNKTSKEEYSSNWAGAVLIGTGYTAVTAEFTVPTPSIPTGRSTNNSTVLLRGSVSYDAWYEWYPDYAYDFSVISLAAGDVIKVTVDASSKTTGTATVENTSTGQSVTHSFDGAVDGDLCEYNTEWIVEDFESNNSLVPFANFGTVIFSNAEATDNGSSVGPSDAILIDISQCNSILTSSSVSGNSVTVKYV